MSDLAAWLLEQIDADEQAARDATVGPWRWKDWGDGELDLTSPDAAEDVLSASGDYGYGATLYCMTADRAHIAAWDPARVLAECEAKRRIVEWHKSWPVLVETEPEFTHEGFALQLSKRIAWLTQQEYAQRFGTEPPTAPVLRMLASVYADRLGYDESWRP